MAQTPKGTVQCFEDDKTFLSGVAEALDWSLPKVVHQAVLGLRIQFADEETAEQRSERMVAKLNNSATTQRNSGTTARNSATPVGNGASRSPADVS